jgi:heme/copper-type cytochrome/quinol oxidase subunit 2
MGIPTVKLKGEMIMEKKATSKTETLLFVFGISFAVFILLFVIIATVISIVKTYKKGGSLLSLLRSAPDEAPDTKNPPLSEVWPVEPIHLNDKGMQANSDTPQAAKRVPAGNELH